MSFTVEGNTVSEFSTSEAHIDFYDRQEDARPQANGLKTRGVDKKTSQKTTYLLLHTSSAETNPGLTIWHYGDDGAEGVAKTTVVDIADKVQTSNYVFESGQGIASGAHGTHDYVFTSGEPVTDDDVSDAVFESGTGIGFANIGSAVEDDPDGFGPSPGSDSYTVDGDDAVAHHLWNGQDPGVGDGVVWELAPGNYSFTIEMADISDGRDSSGHIFPEEWVVVGPSSWAVAKAAGEGTSVSVTIDV